ncbi:MAG: YdcF family protein [Deltaproteobacteria bacterium]|nr:YdcF family protein [Deltaproteobacteria bacterium]
MTGKRIVLLIICFVVLSLLLLVYLDFAKDTAEYKEDGNKADAIVVLTGGRGRLDNGLELFQEGMAAYLIIAGVDKDASFESIFFKRAGHPSKRQIWLDTKRVILEKNSTSTYENAEEIKKIIEIMNIKSIILITSFYHMKRASYIFRRILPAEVDIHLYPISTPNFDERRWWRGRGPILLAVEFLKFYWYRFWI